MAAPTLLAVAFVLAMYVGAGVSILAAVRAIVLAGGAALVLTVIADTLMGDRIRGGVLALVIVLVVIAWVPLVTGILLIIAAALVIERIVARGRDPGARWRLAGRVLDGVALVVLVVLGVQFVASGGVGEVADDLSPLPAPPVLAEAGDRPPDIFVLLLDGHLRPDRFATLFGADLSPLVEQLRDRGFSVAAGSRSNYISTGQSLPTMLNISHWSDLLQEREIDLHTQHLGRALRTLINHSTAITAFSDAGYEVVSVSPGFEEIALRKAHRFIDTGELNEFEYTLLRVTALRPVIETLAPDFLADQHRSRVRAIFGAAVDEAARPSAAPRFVWVHVPSPHAPAVFGPPGGSDPPSPAFDKFFDDTASGNGIDRSTYAERYVDQARTIDELMLDAVDGILAASDRPPVILVLSDHGSGAGLTWSQVGGSDLDERTANLFAASTPGHPDLFGPAPTLVNTLGTLLRTYTTVNPPTLPDTLYEPLNDQGDVQEIDPARIQWP